MTNRPGCGGFGVPVGMPGRREDFVFLYAGNSPVGRHYFNVRLIELNDMPFKGYHNIPVGVNDYFLKKAGIIDRINFVSGKKLIAWCTGEEYWEHAKLRKTQYENYAIKAELLHSGKELEPAL
jgi:hypothetical protein